MLKIRLMGTKDEIKQFKEVLHRVPEVEIMKFSDFYQNRGESKYYRVYAEVQVLSVKEP